MKKQKKSRKNDPINKLALATTILGLVKVILEIVKILLE